MTVSDAGFIKLAPKKNINISRQLVYETCSENATVPQRHR